MRIVRIFPYWNWVEPAPEKFEFDDIDLLFELAAKHGLKVTGLSLLSAVSFLKSSSPRVSLCSPPPNDWLMNEESDDDETCQGESNDLH